MDEGTYFPIFINMQNKECLLFGGGVIGARRAAGLLDFGARVTVVAPRIGPGIQKLMEAYPERLKIFREAYRPGEICADFVFSCTDDKETDLAIYRECKEKAIPVNIASDQSMCDFLFPALAKERNLVVGISSGGRDHKKVRQFAKRLREWMGGNGWK